MEKVFHYLYIDIVNMFYKLYWYYNFKIDYSNILMQIFFMIILYYLYIDVLKKQ